MKFIVFAFIFSTFISCSDSGSKKEIEAQSHANPVEQSGYGMPKIGFSNSINLNNRLNFMYERLTVNPNGNFDVLGDCPYYLEIDEKDAVEVSFYSDTYLKSVKFIHFGNYFNSNKISEISLKDLKSFPVTNIEEFSREFSYGKVNPLHPGQDMLNKAFIVETQEGDYPYVGTMTQMIWLECQGRFVSRAKGDYRCEGGNFKFHYKLLDYKLENQD